jgi:hypothetical protein
MGLAKVVNKGNGKVVLVHQLGMDGVPYAEDVTIENQQGVPESRNDWLAKLDGKIGTVSYSFTPADPQPEGLLFPEV